MTHHQLEHWLEQLKVVWETKNSQGITQLVSEKFHWYETPFTKPLTSKKVLLNEWETILNQKHISFTYEIVTFDKNVGIAHWSAKFVRLPANENVELDGMFQVTLNTQGKCTEFRQWYLSK
jgi:hypothetical protein